MENERNPIKPIVLKELVAEKNQRLARKIPWFVYGWMNRLLHIPLINEVMTKFGHLRGLPFLDAILDFFQVEVETIGLENLPSSGRYIIVCNHPLGGFDGILMLKLLSEKYGTVRSLARDELSKIPPIADLFVPINKFGGQRRSAGLIAEVYSSAHQVLIFPAGLASRKIGGKIQDLAWQKHFVQKSVEYQRDVIPVYFHGRNSGFFYWLANFRKRIGLKVNLEMFLLPDEMFKQRKKRFKIYFGKPIPWSRFDHTKTQAEWAAAIREEVYELGKDVNK